MEAATQNPICMWLQAQMTSIILESSIQQKKKKLARNETKNINKKT
jgi:hypothetical protein